MKTKPKFKAKQIIICVLLLVPFVIQAFKSDLALWEKILAAPVTLFAIFLGSGVVGLVGGFVMHYAAALFRWVCDEEDNTPSDKQYDDLIVYMYALFPVAFIGAYYYLLTGENLLHSIF